MIFVLILAGGTGSRMGAKNPKQFLEIEGKSIVGYTVETFTDNSRIDGIIVLVPDEWIGYTRTIIARDVRGAGMIDVIGGGMLRNDTIICGIDHIKKKYGPRRVCVLPPNPALERAEDPATVAGSRDVAFAIAVAVVLES